MIEFRNFIKARNEQWEEQCREQQRIELEERETSIEENRQAVEAEAREKERIMKQIRRAEMENERLEETDNHNAKDNNDTTAEARADDSTTEEKGGKAKAENFMTEETGNKARADYLAISVCVGVVHKVFHFIEVQCGSDDFSKERVPKGFYLTSFLARVFTQSAQQPLQYLPLRFARRRTCVLSSSLRSFASTQNTTGNSTNHDPRH